MPGYIKTEFQEKSLIELVETHSASDVCIVGARGCGKSTIVHRLAHKLGYIIEPIVLYQVTVSSITVSSWRDIKLWNLPHYYDHSQCPCKAWASFSICPHTLLPSIACFHPWTPHILRSSLRLFSHLLFGFPCGIQQCLNWKGAQLFYQSILVTKENHSSINVFQVQKKLETFFLSFCSVIKFIQNLWITNLDNIYGSLD